MDRISEHFGRTVSQKRYIGGGSVIGGGFARVFSKLTSLLGEGASDDKWLVRRVLVILSGWLWWFMWGRFSSLEVSDMFFTLRQDNGEFVQAHIGINGTRCIQES